VSPSRMSARARMLRSLRRAAHAASPLVPAPLRDPLRRFSTEAVETLRWIVTRQGVSPQVARRIARWRGRLGLGEARSARDLPILASGAATRPYVVWAPPYDPSSGGPKMLHWFVHELNRLGYEAYVTWIPGRVKVNPEWDEPTACPPDSIAVYPDTQYDNPLGAERVARWALNVPGRLPMMALRDGEWVEVPSGGPWGDEPTDLIFPFSRSYNVWGLSEERILHVPIQELDDYTDRGLPRKGRMFYVGKGWQTPRIEETGPLVELDKSITHDRRRLADTLNRIELLYSYDTQTGITEIARLCGCPVVLVPNDHTTRDAVYAGESGADGLGWGVEETEKAIATENAQAMRERMERLLRDFYEVKLPYFIRLTQAL
jgi:hypothetical protein